MKIIHHICIQTDKYEDSLDFYTKILGFKLIKETKNFHNRKFNSWLQLNEFMIELQTEKDGDTLKDWSSLNKGIVHIGFLVDDVEKEYNRIKDLNYNNFKIKNGEELYKVGGSYLFKIKAPEGTEIEMRDKQI